MDWMTIFSDLVGCSSIEEITLHLQQALTSACLRVECGPIASTDGGASSAARVLLKPIESTGDWEVTLLVWSGPNGHQLICAGGSCRLDGSDRVLAAACECSDLIGAIKQALK